MTNSPRNSPSRSAAVGPVEPAMAAGSAEQLTLDLAREMRRRWRSGEQPPAEEFLARYPDVARQPELAVDLIYEEFCLRQAAGHCGVEQEVLRRFPQWAPALRVMLDCHRHVLRSHDEQPDYPVVGDRIGGGFELISELARGGHGRVFLAAQTGLADRPVVLKVTPLDGAEHVSLARLQHSNIVPLYSVLEDPARRVRMLCMPYFGRATLASLLESVAGVPLGERTGRHVLEAIDRAQEHFSDLPAAAADGAARQMLARVSFVQAIAWIGSCLADALRSAHEHGVLHLDIKPSNVLLSSDGQPMLLDFHLARGPVKLGTPLPGNLGGTPAYMPPEQQLAMRSIENGTLAEAAVDGRADMYALGAVLYEALGGRLPIVAASPPLARVNPLVSVGLSDVVMKCVACRPEDRYGDAGSLAEDLRRHLEDRPLVGVANRSVVERCRKWRRRNPGAARAAGVALLAAGAAGLLLATVSSHVRDRRTQAALALGEGRRQLQDERQVSEAVRTFERGLEIARGIPFDGGLREQLREQLVIARRLDMVRQVRQLADEVRVLYGAENLPAPRLPALSALCSKLWENRGLILGAADGISDARLATDLQDIAIFIAGLELRLADNRDDAAARRSALRVLDEAAETFGAGIVLEHERQAHRTALGMLDPAAPLPPSYNDTPPRAWDHYALGRAFICAGDLPRAGEELAAALNLEPADRWANFYYGLYAYRTGRHEEAVTAFSVCVGADGSVAGNFYNRAMALFALDRSAEALRDYDRALKLDPAHCAAALNRGALHLRRGRHDLAIADFHLALRNGADAATAHYNLASAHHALGQSSAALRHARLALEANPAHDDARQLSQSLPANSSAE